MTLCYRSRKENLQLSAEYNKLQESYRQLEAMKEQLETQASTWQSNLTDSQKETEQTRHQVGDRQPIRGLVTAGSNVMAGSNVTGSPGQQVLPAWALKHGWVWAIVPLFVISVCFFLFLHIILEDYHFELLEGVCFDW